MSDEIPFTEKSLQEWAGWRVFRDGKALFARGVVEKVQYEAPIVSGLLNLGPRGIRSRFKVLSNGLVDNLCPCRDNQERGLICAHLVALGLELLKRNANPAEGQRTEQEILRAQQLEAAPQRHRIQRVKKSAPGAVPARLTLELEAGWRARVPHGAVTLSIFIEAGEERIAAAEVPSDLLCSFNHRDENILYLLEELAGDRLRNRLTLTIRNFIALLRMHQGKPLGEEGRKAGYAVEKESLHSVVGMDIDRETGELLLEVRTGLEEPLIDEPAVYLIGPSGGWVFFAGHFYPLSELVPRMLREIYVAPVRIPRDHVPRFLMTELPQVEQFLVVRSEISADLFTMKPAVPVFRLRVKGSPASLAATLYACYDQGAIELTAGRADMRGNFAIPDPDDLMSYRIRNMAAEKRAVQALAAVGFVGRAGDTLRNIVGTDEVLNFLGSGVPQIRRMGWTVELDGRVKPFYEATESVRPSVRVVEAGHGDYFEVSYEYEAGTASISERDVQRALANGQSFIKRDDRVILLDADAVRQALEVFKDCAAEPTDRPGTMRVAGIHGSYVEASLRALEDVAIAAVPTWFERARQLNDQERVEPVELSPHLDATLRSYQYEGVNWLRFLEKRGLCGILADEMGLGKTLQTLAWLQLERVIEPEKRLPALVVCPTSLVENWREESARFTPNLDVLLLHGPERHRRWKKVDQADLVITSYALMRRDVEKHLARTYSVVILDEAQHIKNRSTQNANVAKQLRAHHRLVLTGTPVENGVTDLWSIMDFLMPGYLGKHKDFREAYELPILNGGEDAEYVHGKLRRKLHPFLLRRMKKQVAKDLPDKIEDVKPCKMTQDQDKVYQQLLEESRQRISSLVEKDGFQKSRMEILQTLLRLRQVCCHIDLLKLDGVKSRHPSAKMELFFELVDEAMDGGHRMLVFSQFTSMLAILRDELEKRELKYCYLDGATKDRQEVVRRFNKEPSIPIFLMSLKAGGTGLNLTGADTVIHYDPWWNPAVEAQATDRAHRIGQKNTVNSYKLITRGTVEEKVLSMQQRKRELIDATLSTDEQVMQRLSWEDIQELLNL